MNLSPEIFIKLINEGKTEVGLNKKEDLYIDPFELKKLTSKRYGHTLQSATKHLQTDYSNGFTICKCCGSFYQLGEGFTKHISNGCLHCEGKKKHHTYHVNASPPRDGGFPARWMSNMFDDGMSYCKDKLQIGIFKNNF
jgi:hypothetical protein